MARNQKYNLSFEQIRDGFKRALQSAQDFAEEGSVELASTRRFYSTINNIKSDLYERQALCDAINDYLEAKEGADVYLSSAAGVSRINRDDCVRDVLLDAKKNKWRDIVLPFERIPYFRVFKEDEKKVLHAVVCSLASEPVPETETHNVELV